MEVPQRRGFTAAEGDGTDDSDGLPSRTVTLAKGPEGVKSGWPPASEEVQNSFDTGFEKG